MSEEIISVITPLYNTSVLFVNELYNALKKQTFDQWTWHLVNDGSEDEVLLDFINKLATSDVKVQVSHHKSNLGLPAARNSGIIESESDYLFFIDADDLLHPTLLEKSYLALVQNPSFSFVNSYVVGFGAQNYQWTGGFHDRERFLTENRNTSCFMARRAVFEKVLFDETMLNGCEDWDFWLHAASKGFWGYTIPEFLFFYRRSDMNKWPAMDDKQALSKIKVSLQEKYGEDVKRGFSTPGFLNYSFGYLPQTIPAKSYNGGSRQHLLCIFPWIRVGGADQFNFNLLEGLKEKGWSFTILTTLGQDHPWEEKFQGLTNDIFHLDNLGNDYQFSSLIVYFIKSRSPKLVFLSNSMYGYTILPFLKSAFPTLPIVDYLHCEDLGWYNGGYPYFSSLYTSFIDYTFTSSKNLFTWCVTNGIPASKLEVAYVNVDATNIQKDEVKRKKVRQELGIENDIPLLLYVARLTPQKQPQTLAKTLAALQEKGFTFHCVIIGDGPDRESLVSFLKKKKLLSRVSYLGSQSNGRVLEYMDAADVFFLPSLYEGIALSIYEAMAKRLAIVSADVGGQAELVSDDCGFLIAKGTENEVDAYVEHLGYLFRNDDVMRKMGACSQKRVFELFNLPEMIEQVHATFQKVIPFTANLSSSFPDIYLHAINHNSYLEKENVRLYAMSNSRSLRVLARIKQPYQGLRNFYHKCKDILKS